MTYLVERLAELRRHLDHLRDLASIPGFPPGLAAELERLPGFRDLLIHEYVSLDLQRAVEALDRLAPVEQFAELVRRMESPG